MANFAKLGKGNKVLKVEPIHNDCAPTEQAGIDFLNGLYKTNDVWVQTSYNGKHQLLYLTQKIDIIGMKQQNNGTLTIPRK